MLVPQLINLILISISIALLTFIPGVVLLGAFTSLRENELIASSPGVSFLILGAIVFVGNIIGANQFAFNYAMLAALLLLITALMFYRKPALPIKPRLMVGLFLLFFLHLLAFQCLLPIYAGGEWYGDWWEHYSIAQVYLYHGDYQTVWFGCFNLLTRTPLFNLVASFFLSIFSDHFWVFQVASTIMNSVFILPLYLLTKRLFGKKTGVIAVVFLTFNTWVLHQAWFTWPKMLNVYFIFLFVHYYLRFKERDSSNERNIYFFSLFCALAFMSHQLAALYILGIFLDYLISRPSCRECFKNLVKFFTISFAVVSPWYLWAASIFGAKSWIASTPTAIAMTGYRSLPGLLKVFLNNAYKSIVPVLILREPSYASLINFYYNPILGAITITVGLYILYLLIKNRTSGKLALAERLEGNSEHFTMLLLVIVGYFGAFAVQYDVSGSGIAHNTMVPLVLILLIYVARLLELAGKEIVVLFSGIVIEFGISTWYQVYRLIANKGLSEIAANNLVLKSAGGLVFLRDYIGGWWSLPALCAVVLELAALYMLYTCNIRSMHISSKSGSPPR